MDSEIEAPVQVAEAPAVEHSAEAIAAAFASPQPYNPTPASEPVAAAPVEVVPPIEAAVPAPTPAVAVAPETVTPQAPDYAAWLKEQELPEDVAVIKTALQTAEALKANQRTAQDVAFEQLLADPAKAVQFVKLQTTDFTALSPRELLSAAYAHAHPDLSPEVAAIRAKREYEAEYSAAEFDDADDPAVQEAKVLLNAAVQSAVQTMEGAKTAAREAVLSKATPTAEGPSEADTKAEADAKANGEAWFQGVENVINAEKLSLAYDLDGQPITLDFDHKTPAFKEAMLNPQEWLFKEVCPTGDPKAPNLDRLAEIVALVQQTDVMLKNAAAHGQSRLGAVIPLTQAVNPIPNAPQAPPGLVNSDNAVAAAIRNASGAGNKSIYN